MLSVLPDGATKLGNEVDMVQLVIILIMAVCFIACNAVLIYFMLKYKRRSADQETAHITGNHMLETIWTVVPAVVCALIFWYGIKVWSKMREIPEGAYEVQVTGQKWSWVFEYPDGRVMVNELYAPEGQPVKLTMKSKDVIHSLFVPEFRIKEDVVPSYFTYQWFQADQAGVYNIFCTEYCGDEHSGMLGKVHVLNPDDWGRFLRNEPDPDAKELTPVERGEELFTKRTCITCHSVDGAKGIGPTFQNLMGRTEKMADGSEVVVDENYIVESINNPNLKIVEGFLPNQMPSFDGQLTDQDLKDIIAYIKTLK